jgi:O-antigen/teichoic acid export membrane protein
MLWDLSSLALGQILSIALGFAGFAYLGRALSPETYGLVEYAVGLVSLAAIVVEGGTGAVGTLQVSRDPAHAPRIAGTVAGTRLLLALLVVPLVGLSSMAMHSDATVTTLTWCFALSLLAIPFKYDWLLQGLDRMGLVAPAQAVKSGAFAIGVILLVRADDDIITVGVLEAGAAMIGVVYFLIAQRVVSVPLSVDLRFSSVVALMKAGVSIGASNILWPFMVYAPVLLVTRLSGSTDAAWLGGAQRIVVALVAFGALYFFNLYPLIIRNLRDDLDRWRRLMGSSVRLIGWAGFGIAMATTVLSETIITTVFGPRFATAAPVLALCIWTFPLRLLSGHARFTLLAAERQNVLLLVELIAAGTIVVACLALIPEYGAAGAAAAGIIGNVAGWLLAHASAERYAGWLPGPRQVARPLGAALLGVVAARLIGEVPIAGAAAALVTYSICLGVSAPDLIQDGIRLAYAKKTTEADRSS